MSRSAKVHSIDALDHLAQAVRSFAQEAMVALDDVRMDIHRAIQWVEHDQKDYWSQESRKAQDAVTEARIALERKQMRLFGDEQPSCYEEKKALEAAKRRGERARQKTEAVKRWSRLLENESHDCRSGIASLADWLQTDVPRALATLKRLSLALESYVDLESSAAAEGAAASPGDAGEEAKPGATPSESSGATPAEPPERDGPPGGTIQ